MRNARLKLRASGIKPRDHRSVQPRSKQGTLKVADPLYGAAVWVALRQRLLRERGAHCESPLCTSPHRGADGVIYADHIVELADGGAPLDERNVQLLCRSCHKIKTAYTRGERARADAANWVTPRWPGSVGQGVIKGDSWQGAQGAGRDGEAGGGGWGCL